MPEVLTISSQKPENTALDYQELRKLGIEHIEKVASAIWTDYNVHDPGITTLELLCFAITDLGYRNELSIPDLLASPTDTAKHIHAHFLSAKNVFPNKAVTINDYRKLLIDIDKVKNAWISRDTKTIYADLINKKLSHTKPDSRRIEEVTVRGFYKVLLEFDTNVKEEEKDAVKQEARKILNINRNLCCDFTTITEVTQEPFRLCAEIEIEPQADPFKVMAEVFFNIQLHLCPMVKFYRLAQLFDEKYPSDQIFEGPLLTHGFIKDDELNVSELKTELHLSDIMHQILDVKGVDNILDVQFSTTSKTQKSKTDDGKWFIDVTEGKQPVVSILSSRIVLYKGGIPFRPDLGQIQHQYEQLMDAYISANEQVTTEDILYNTGTYRNTGQYTSIQHHYPKTYGISHWGLPDNVPAERKMQAKQLQAYLYFFDQQLANYFAQLANLDKLFSLDTEIKQTYFTQIADDFKDANDLFALPAELMKNNIQQAAEGPEVFNERRNLFLDHLLSRFSESFFDYVHILQDVFPAVEPQELINTKIRFLKNYPAYSSERFGSFNYTDKTSWNTDNISGMEKRLQSLLGFKNIQRRSLVNLFSTIKTDTANVATPFYFELLDNRSGNTLMLSAEKFTSPEIAQQELDSVMEMASDLSKFNTSTAAGGSQFIIELKSSIGKVLAVSKSRYHTSEDAVTALTALHMQILNQSDEGLFLVENLLLLPEADLPTSPLEPLTENRGFMPICADDNCDDCNSNDPYSFRIGIVLPAYAERFLNMDFRRYCERIIRMETPAHVFPKICWVNNEQLRDFENAYQNWLAVKAGLVSDQDNKILERFIMVMNNLKTVYPPAKLQDCSSTEQRRLFLLNQNALGTLKK